MLTNNWYALMKNYFCRNNNFPKATLTLLNGSTWTSTGEQLGSSTYASGPRDYIDGVFFGQLANVKPEAYTSASTDFEFGVMFGNGTTPPTVNDYKMSGARIAGISVSASATVTVNENQIVKTALFTVTNNSTTDSITISEVGYVGEVETWKTVLMDRTLLEEPVIIPPGGVGQITYTIPFNIGAIEA